MSNLTSLMARRQAALAQSEQQLRTYEAAVGRNDITVPPAALARIHTKVARQREAVKALAAELALLQQLANDNENKTTKKR